ncbi:hypothetical protein EI427_01450 [Flammeovirga pectinis]|uniref:Glycine zipper domain-containing protein n=1 Tax=Flammeovirga pectinis TaxID=2494373 RepID=A0A3Q9FT50_9BACT|nr:hypothetical protein EI427_01450 [Flammeovirga pectinis]
MATPPPNTAAPTVSISKQLGLFVFPAKDQSTETQMKDEQACFAWATEQTGYTPDQVHVEAKQVQAAPAAGAVGGAAKGAIAGVAIGAIAGDAGKGAAIGATAGGLKGIGGSRRRAAAQQNQNNQAAAAKQKELLGNFNKAYSACMTGKGYTVQ